MDIQTTKKSITKDNKLTYSIAMLTDLCRDNLKTPFDGKLICLAGFYLTGKDKNYSGVYYDILQDDTKTGKITLSVPATIRKSLKNRQYYTFDGYLNKRLSSLNNGTIQLHFRVIKIKEHRDEFKFISKDEFSIVQERFNREIPDISESLLNRILDKQKPKITIITGHTSIVDEDMKSQLFDIEYFDIETLFVNLSIPSKITSTIKEASAKSCDLIVLIRGGGDTLDQVFNDIDLCKEALNCSVPFATAIGHKVDRTLLEKSADKGFATPTAVGIFLQNIVNRYKLRVKERQEHEQVVLDLKKELISLKKDVDIERKRERDEREKIREVSARREKKLVYAVLSLLFLFIVCLLIIFT